MALYNKPNISLERSDLDIIDGIVGLNEAVIGADLNTNHSQWDGDTVNVSGKTLQEWLLTNPSIVLRQMDETTRCA